MSLKKKTSNPRKKLPLLEHQIKTNNNIHQKNGGMTAENINQILDRYFLALELIKFNLFGEDFENYGNLEINGQTYYPNKLDLDYLAQQQSDEAKRDLDIDVDILNSLKKADDITKINIRNISKINSTKNNITTSKYKKMFKSKSMENINLNIKEQKPADKFKLKLPKIFKNKKPFHNIALADNYMKLILLKNFDEPLTSLNSKDFIMRKSMYIKRHLGAKKLNKKLNALENRLKNIGNVIKNEEIINKEKIPQFQYRYKYVESKFRV